jgi:hypothetical protein
MAACEVPGGGRGALALARAAHSHTCRGTHYLSRQVCQKIPCLVQQACNLCRAIFAPAGLGWSRQAHEAPLCGPSALELLGGSLPVPSANWVEPEYAVSLLRVVGVCGGGLNVHASEATQDCMLTLPSSAAERIEDGVLCLPRGGVTQRGRIAQHDCTDGQFISRRVATTSLTPPRARRQICKAGFESRSTAALGSP